MSPTLQDFGIDQLSPADRLALAEAIWESVVSETEQAPVPATQRAELERRLADSIARPDAVTPWEEVKARVLPRYEVPADVELHPHRQRGAAPPD